MGGLTSQDCSPVCMLRIQNNIAVLSRNRHSTTDIIEGLNQQYRKVTKTKSVFPSDILYLASKNLVKKWTQRYRNWDQVLRQLIRKWQIGSFHS